MGPRFWTPWKPGRAIPRWRHEANKNGCRRPAGGLTELLTLGLSQPSSAFALRGLGNKVNEIDNFVAT